MTCSLIMDVSRESDEIDFSQWMDSASIVDEIIIIRRANQDIIQAPILSTIIECGTVETEVDRAAIGLRSVTTDGAIYTCGSVVQEVLPSAESLAGVGSFACGRVDRTLDSQGQLVSDTGARVRSFYVKMHNYIALRGFNSKYKSLRKALEEFQVRCELMGWRTTFEHRVYELKALSASQYSAIDSMETGWEPPATVSLISNLPVWPHRPYVSSPLVTVAISTFNRAEYLKTAIESVLAQTFQDFEIVIVDDGSEDNTAEVVSEFHDDRIVYAKIDNSGIAYARNRAAELSAGFFTAVHDSDDLMMPHRLESGLAALHDDFHASYGAWVNFDNSSSEMVMHVTKLGFDLDIVANNGQTPGHPTWLLPTQIIRELRYDTRLSSAVDHNVAVRSALVGLKWAHTGGAVMLRRIHTGQISLTDSGQQRVGALLTRQLSVNGRQVGNELEGMGRATSRRWPDIKEKRNLDHFFRRYLPDNLADRIVEVTGPIGSKIGILTSFQGAVGIAAELNGNGEVRTERAWVHNPSWEALAKLATAGYKYTLRSGTHEHNTDSIIEAWLLGRMRNISKTHNKAIWSFTYQNSGTPGADSANLGFYCKYESGVQTTMLGVPVSDSSDLSSFVAKSSGSDPFLIASESIEDSNLLAVLGVNSND